MGIRWPSLSISILCLSLGLSGCDSSKIPGIDHFKSGVSQNKLYVSFVATALQLGIGLTIPIPGLDNATLAVAPHLSSGGTIFEFNIELKSLLGKPLQDQQCGLPDGRALPDVRDGKLPCWNFMIGKQIVYVYLSEEAFAFFVPLDFIDPDGSALPTTISVEIDDEKGNLLGKAYAIPSGSDGGGSGLFILLPYIGRTLRQNAVD